MKRILIAIAALSVLSCSDDDAAPTYNWVNSHVYKISQLKVNGTIVSRGDCEQNDTMTLSFGTGTLQDYENGVAGCAALPVQRFTYERQSAGGIDTFVIDIFKDGEMRHYEENIVFQTDDILQLDVSERFGTAGSDDEIIVTYVRM